MMTKKEPKQIQLTVDEAQALKQRVLTEKLSEQDKELLVGLVSFNLWVYQQLTLAKLSIRKLKRLFGFKREKKTLKTPMM